MLTSKFQVMLHQGLPAGRTSGAAPYGATEDRGMSLFMSNVR
jgi:hypothetical protein